MRVTWPELMPLRDNQASTIQRSVVTPIRSALQQLRTILDGKLTVTDNTNSKVVKLGYAGNSSQTLGSGVEYTFTNPLDVKPAGFTPLYGVTASGTACQLFDWSLNLSRTDGLSGLTINFNPSPAVVTGILWGG